MSVFGDRQDLTKRPPQDGGAHASQEAEQKRGHDTIQMTASQFRNLFS